MHWTLCVLLSCLPIGFAEWEWEGDVHHVEPGNYTMTFKKVEGAYADATMMVSFHKEEGLNEADVEAMWTAGAATSGSKMWKAGVLYSVEFDDSLYATIQELVIAGEGDYVFFLQHFPSEFDLKDEDFLIDSTGKSFKAEQHKEASEPPVGLVIGATLIVSLLSFAGLLLIQPLKCGGDAMKSIIEVLSNGFAAGCIMATGFFLMLPEAYLLINADSESEAGANTIFGISAIFGYILGALIHWIADLVIKKDASVTPAEGQESGEPDKSKSFLERWKPVVWTVLFGDFFHNIVDGIAIGVAFKTCDSATGWVVTLSAASHEISQEFADYLVLTNAGMSPTAALLTNFLSGCSCILGGIIAVYVDMSMGTEGGLLAFGAGTYFWIACTECFPKILDGVAESRCKGLLMRIGSFLFGVLVIGLVLISHTHCDGGGGGHDGHNH